MTVTIDRFSVVYSTDNNGLVTRSVLTNNMAVLSDSATYNCISTVEGIQTTDNITIFVYGKYSILLILMGYMFGGSLLYLPNLVPCHHLFLYGSLLQCLDYINDSNEP